MLINLLSSSGFKSPSKATHYEWLDTTRTTFQIGKPVTIDSTLSALDAFRYHYSWAAL
uniref:Uncharacterized protein n=1 Tax=Heterorhabditis bacteriophora TaxID=37862 RepID=A0A1I7WEU3_HETBA